MSSTSPIELSFLPQGVVGEFQGLAGRLVGQTIRKSRHREFHLLPSP